MKIAILSNNDAGMWLFRRELLTFLVSDGHAVYLSVPDGDYVARIRRLGVKVTTCGLLDRRGKNPVKDLRLLHYYRQLLRHVTPDAVLTYTIKPNVYGGIAARAEHIPVLANVTGLGDAIERGGLLSKLTLAMYREGLKGARCVFFQNAENERFFRKERIVMGRTRLLPGSGVNLEAFRPIPYPAGDVRLLYAGRIMKDKGIDELLAMMRRLQAATPAEISRVHLDIAGYPDEDYGDILTQAEKEGFVTYHGMVDDLRPLYAKAHAVILPSYHEGMNNVLQEAGASARPVLASDISGCREIVEDGVTGFLFAPRDTDALLAAVERFLTLPADRRAEMGKQARHKMEREFSRQQVVEAYTEEISDIN